MSPHRRHSGGRPRTASSILDFAEQWGISEKAARRLRSLNLDGDALALQLIETRHSSARQRVPEGRQLYTGGMKALGQRSRTRGDRA
jgi:hypothetical protein